MVPKPALVLRQWPHLLPEGGAALDLACGLGGNALRLAERGFRVSAWDLSPDAIARLREAARLRGFHLDARVRDLAALPPSPESFDLIPVAHLLDRDPTPSIAAALCSGGFATRPHPAESRAGQVVEDAALQPVTLIIVSSTERSRTPASGS